MRHLAVLLILASLCLLTMRNPKAIDAQQAERIDKGRSFSAMQMTGEPDTPRAGDYGTCWAAQDADIGKVWLELDYPRMVFPSQVWVYENCAPGAVFQVTGIDDGEEFQLWRGSDPTPRTADKGISKINISTQRRLKRIRVYLDCKAVPGWNEIDCVGLVDQQQQMHWAVAARASSVYSTSGGIRFVDPFADPAVVFQERVDELARAIRDQMRSIQSLKLSVLHQEETLKKMQAELNALIQRPVETPPGEKQR